MGRKYHASENTSGLRYQFMRTWNVEGLLCACCTQDHKGKFGNCCSLKHFILTQAINYISDFFSFHHLLELLEDGPNKCLWSLVCVNNANGTSLQSKSEDKLVFLHSCVYTFFVFRYNDPKTAVCLFLRPLLFSPPDPDLNLRAAAVNFCVVLLVGIG